MRNQLYIIGHAKWIRLKSRKQQKFNFQLLIIYMSDESRQQGLLSKLLYNVNTYNKPLHNYLYKIFY